MARLVLSLLAVLPLFALAMDQYVFYFCPSLVHDGSKPNDAAIYAVKFKRASPLKLFAAAEPTSGESICALNMTYNRSKGVTVSYNKNGSVATTTSSSYGASNITMNYQFQNCTDKYFGCSPGGSASLMYNGLYNGIYWVYKNAVWTAVGCFVRYYVFVPNNIITTAVNFTKFQADFKAAYNGVTLLPKVCQV